MKDNRRKKCLLIRLTDDEYTEIKKRSERYNSISHYIRSAIGEYSDMDAKDRLDSISRLSEYYDKYHSALYHTSANLNQAMRRANELASAGLLSDTYIVKELMPRIDETMMIIGEVRKDLVKVMRTIIKG